MAEAVATEALGGGIVEIGKYACKLLTPHIQYLFCYRQKVKELDDKISNELGPKRADIQAHVDAAERRGDRVTNELQPWRDDLEKLEGVNKANVDGAAAAPCFCWGYRFGKRAARGLEKADSLKSRADRFISHGVSLPAPPPATEVLLPTDSFRALGTTESCMKRVMEALQDGNVGRIGVHGMGGVGKSTLMKEVLRSCAKADGVPHFKEVVFAVVSEDANVKRIRQQIAEGLGLSEDVNKVSDLTGAAKIRERLMKSEKGVLVVLDDLWKVLDLSLVGIPTSCKVVITTRNKRVCTGMGCSASATIELKTLSEDESWELFSQTARVDETAGTGPHVIELAREAAKKCDGLPLALTILGKTMRGIREAEEWSSALKELQEQRPIDMEDVRIELYNVMKLSFDRLRSPEDRLCFLFLCLFPEDYCISLDYHRPTGEYTRHFEIPLPTFTWYAVGDGFLEDTDVHTLADAQKRVRKILVKLKDCGLLIDGDLKKDEDADEDEQVKMHDVVRHVALQIAAAASSTWTSSSRGDHNNGYGLYYKDGDALQRYYNP